MKPKFTICRLGAQEKVQNVNSILTDVDFAKICKKLTKQTQYEIQWVDERIKGKMFVLETDDSIYYITYTPKVVGGRNSYLQSVPTAFGLYLKESINSSKSTQFCLYFTPVGGGNKTRYHQFMYRLLKSIGIVFLNAEEGLCGLQLREYQNVRELIKDRENNRSRNSYNQSSYITDVGTSYYIYGKTFGANQKETTMLCMALCNISDKPIILFQVPDNDSDYLSKADIDTIVNYASRHGKVRIEILDDNYEFAEEDEHKYSPVPTEEGLRDPRFIYNLLEKTNGHKCCSLCHCEIESIVQGAHIYPVQAIKRRDDLTHEEKLRMATDKNNGIWLCENHHKLFDRGLIRFDGGKLQIMPRLNTSDAEFVKTISTCDEIPSDIYTPEMDSYFQIRDEFYRQEKFY